MRRLFYVYLAVLLIALGRHGKRRLRRSGEAVKRLGRAIVAWGEDETPRFGIKFFNQCYASCPDVEIHTSRGVFRGPMYAAYLAGTAELVFKLNWSAESAEEDRWKASGGECHFRLPKCCMPSFLPNGDVWFSFDIGYAVLFLGEPCARLEFAGEKETPRVYAYF